MKHEEKDLKINEAGASLTDNELIAQFMGLPLTKKSLSFVNTGHDIEIPFMRWKYHEEWNWLMDVVIKCHEIGDAKEKQFPEDKNLDEPTGWRAWSYRRVGLSTNIEHTYKNVVNFIKWYNATRSAEG